MKLLLDYIIVTICVFSFYQCAEPPTDRKEHLAVDPLRRSVLLVNDNYLIDTNIISNNENLKNFVTIISSDSIRFSTTDSFSKNIEFFLKSVHKGRFEVARGDELWDATGVYVKGLNVPDKKLEWIGKSRRLCMLQFVQGGTIVTRKLYLMEIEKGLITDFWYSKAPLISSKEELILYLNSQVRTLD